MTDSRRGCENNMKREKMKDGDVKSMGQELGQGLDNQFNSGKGSSLSAATRGAHGVQQAPQ